MGYQLVLVEETEVAAINGELIFQFDTIDAPLELTALGLANEQARLVLESLQQVFVDIQSEKLAADAREAVRYDPDLRLKDYRTRKIDTLFGRVEVRSPRLRNREGLVFTHAHWPPHQRATPSLEKAIIQLGAWMSYREGISLLKDFYPIADGASLRTAWRKLQARGSELTDEELTAPNRARRIDVALDTTFIRSTHRDPSRGHEILMGQVENNKARRCYFGAVYGDKHASKIAVQAALAHVGRTAKSVVTAFTDGAEGLRGLCRMLGLKAKPILDWFHIAMRIRHVSQAATGLAADTPEQEDAKSKICRAVERVRWKLWHGHKNALTSGIDKVRQVLHLYQGERKYLYQPAPSRKVWAGLFALEKYVKNQQSYTVNYANRYRAGKRVGTSMSESAASHLVNARMNKQQSMRWSRNGAHNLLQVRAAEFNRVYNNAEYQNPYAA